MKKLINATIFISAMALILCVGLPYANAASSGVNCISINPENIRVEMLFGGWVIMDGSRVVFDFRNKTEEEARKAKAVIQHYGINQYCGQGTNFEYALISGRAPTGKFEGEDCIDFNPANITVENIQGRWKIVDGNHWMFDFNNNEEEARAAFNIIKKYGFSQTCYVGRPHAPFQYLRTMPEPTHGGGGGKR